MAFGLQLGLHLAPRGLVDQTTVPEQQVAFNALVVVQSGDGLSVSADLENTSGEALNVRIVGVPTGETAPIVSEILLGQASGGSAAEIDINLPAFDGDEAVSLSGVEAGTYDFYGAGETAVSGDRTGVASYLGVVLVDPNPVIALTATLTDSNKQLAQVSGGSGGGVAEVTLTLTPGERHLIPFVGNESDMGTITLDGEPCSILHTLDADGAQVGTRLIYCDVPFADGGSTGTGVLRIDTTGVGTNIFLFNNAGDLAAISLNASAQVVGTPTVLPYAARGGTLTFTQDVNAAEAHMVFVIGNGTSMTTASAPNFTLAGTVASPSGSTKKSAILFSDSLATASAFDVVVTTDAAIQTEGVLIRLGAA